MYLLRTFCVHLPTTFCLHQNPILSLLNQKNKAWRFFTPNLVESLFCYTTNSAIPALLSFFIQFAYYHTQFRSRFPPRTVAITRLPVLCRARIGTLYAPPTRLKVCLTQPQPTKNLCSERLQAFLFRLERW